MGIDGPVGETPRSRMRRWAVAATVAGTLHAATAAGLLCWPESDDDETAGPITVELAPTVMTAATQALDVAPGPAMQEAVATPAAVNQVAERVDKETTQLDPSPAPEPDVTLPKSQQAKEIEPEKEKREQEVQAENAPAAQASPAPITTAPPRVEANTGARTAAQAPGASSIPTEARLSWYRSMVNHLNRYKRYPQDAEAQRQEGVVSVDFTLDRTGKVVAARISRGSGFASLDEEALAVLQRASPLPAPPDAIGANGLDLQVPFQFRMKR